jgi:hypothetical protein
MTERGIATAKEKEKGETRYADHHHLPHGRQPEILPHLD